MWLTPLALLVGAATPAGTSPAARLSLSLPAMIDARIEERLTADGVTPAAPADDATLVRRLTLDLVGRIPVRAEVEAYQRSADADKRAKLVDRLLASPAFARYQGYLFDLMLADPGRRGNTGQLREYLTRAVGENRPWDRVFRELLLPDEAANKGAGEFLRPRLADADRLTVDVSVAFFGVNVSCAQCHDHPHVPDWTQDHFYGMKAFLARTHDAGGFVAERGVGRVRFKPNKGAEKSAKMMFLAGGPLDHPTDREPTADENKAEKAAGDKAKAGKTPPPAPAFSARAKLVELAVADQAYLSRAVVNRLWHRFLGRGLVNPLDQMHAENPATHPELLDALAADLVAHGYDLRRLVRGIVLSRAYGRASDYPSAAHPPIDAFAVARVRPLTPPQLATSLKLAAADPAAFDPAKPDFEKRIEQAEAAASGLARQLPVPADNFQVGVGEALLFSNGERVAKEFLADGGDTLLGKLKSATDAEAIDAVVRNSFGRPPTADEKAALGEYLAARADRKADARRQALWAVVTSPGFRFNH